MNKIKIKVSHSIIMLSTLLLWFFAMLFVSKLFGIDTSVTIDNLPLTTNIIAFASGVSLFLVFLLGGNLISYTIIARFLKVPRYELEQVIEERSIQDSRENSDFVQKFYKWCLNIAYN